MTNTALHSVSSIAAFPARLALPETGPWIPGGPGKFFKPLRFMSGYRGFVELLRLEPGIEMPLHRHTGEVHAFNLEGSRELCTGEVIDAGQYVYEPAGNIDSWIAIGPTPLIVFVVVMGEVEFYDENHAVRLRVSASTQHAAYQEYCASKGLTPQDLLERALTLGEKPEYRDTRYRA
jgi:quercetin dioxygenase-like cupin family protein